MEESKELIIDSNPSEVVIGLLENKQLVELNKEKSNNSISVGDIFLGRIKKLVPGLNAAFVNVGYEKDAFLHYLDLGSNIKSLNKFCRLAMHSKGGAISMDKFKFEKEIEKTGKISNVFTSGQEVVVQIAKEPISTKGPRISSELSIPGRFLVLVPFSDRISISQKIKSPEERKRLKRLVTSIKPVNFGIIIRTVAENKMVAELDNDLQQLVNRWHAFVKNMRHAKAPQKLLGETNRTTVILRDILSDDFNSIYINDQTLFEDTKTYINNIAPKKSDIVKHYKGKKNIFEYFNIDKQIKGLFGRTVTIKGGAYLVIEHTEAMHVIDVNSGNRAKSEGDQEANAIAVNLEAAREISRQLRLRDMGGIIVVDFIDMHEASNRRLLYQKLKEFMKADRAKHNILPPSKFGLVQITRQRVKPEMNIKTQEKCPTCQGSGEIEASINIIDEIENNLRYLFREQNEKSITLAVHQFVFSFITKGLFSIRLKWALKYKRKLSVVSKPSYHYLQYGFFNKDGEELKL